MKNVKEILKTMLFTMPLYIMSNIFEMGEVFFYKSLLHIISQQERIESSVLEIFRLFFFLSDAQQGLSTKLAHTKAFSLSYDPIIR